jgi:hypothetical protein
MAVLREFQELVREVGKTLQRACGREKPDGDFGIDLLATATGDVFRGGSITATGALTRNVAEGDIVMSQIICTADALERKRPVSFDDHMQVRIVKGLAKIGEIQRQDHTEFSVAFKQPGHRKKIATLTESGVQALETMESELVHVEGVTIYGKLFDLRDRSKTDDLGPYIWGELRTDGGDVWRVRFDSRKAKEITGLFTKQVQLSGNAIYSKTRNPQLHVENFVEDEPKNYVAAFDELEGADADLYGSENLEHLMREVRGEA